MHTETKRSLIHKLKSFMTPFQWFEVLLLVAFTAYFAFTDHESSKIYLIVNSISAICGVFCVVLCAAGKKSQYYFGFVNITTYIFIAFLGKYYGQVALNALYYLPTQFVGMYVWNKHMNAEEDVVKTKKMSLQQMLLYGVFMIAGAILCRFLLERLGGNQTWLDSATLVLSLVANALMVLRYKEQWALWIVVDIITVIMWVLAKDWIQVSMWAIYLLNAFYGYYMWSQMNRKNAANE